ncbi:MAG: mechanosensitive ion channel family protein [Erysipelotrichaceae bacterium]
MTEIYNQINAIGSSFFELGLLSTIITWILILLVAYFTKKAIRRIILRKFGDASIFLVRIAGGFIYGLAIYSCSLLIIPLKSVALSVAGASGIIVLIAGIAAQEAVSNLVGGIFITMFKPFSIGDLIKISENNLTGYVEDISLRHTIISTFENTKIVVPNSVINKSVLENLSITNGIKGNFLEIGIAYESDLHQAMDLISNIIIKHPSFIDIRSEAEIADNQPRVNVRLHAFGDSAMVLKVLFHTADAGSGIAMLSDVRIALKHAFDTHGIEIPFQHHVVMLKQEEAK